MAEVAGWCLLFVRSGAREPLRCERPSASRFRHIRRQDSGSPARMRLEGKKTVQVIRHKLMECGRRVPSWMDAIWAAGMWSSGYFRIPGFLTLACARTADVDHQMMFPTKSLLLYPCLHDIARLRARNRQVTLACKGHIMATNGMIQTICAPWSLCGRGLEVSAPAGVSALGAREPRVVCCCVPVAVAPVPAYPTRRRKPGQQIPRSSLQAPSPWRRRA